MFDRFQLLISLNAQIQNFGELVAPPNTVLQRTPVTPIHPEPEHLESDICAHMCFLDPLHREKVFSVRIKCNFLNTCVVYIIFGIKCKG